MKKTAFIALAALSTMVCKADEGMWTLYDLPQAVYSQMNAYGFQLPYSSLYQADDAIRNNVVSFCGYCSGVVVSPDGLLFTNHHCGFDAIRRSSTVEHDYMLNGFCAKSYEEEIPDSNTFVSFMVGQEDVTNLLEKHGALNLTDSKRRVEIIDSIANEMTSSAKAQDSSLHVEIDPYFEGNKYYATTYRVYPDVRLVFNVPKSMGKFGGETDNWMWPRQTCDYSVFRIYVDPKTGKPAKYDKDNVPFHPATWAKVSMDGYKPGDFAMTMGYPGSTSRYLSSYGIQVRRDALNAPRVQNREVKQEVMWRHMLADEAVRIKYESMYARSANYWKNSIGMNKCIDSVGLIRQKAAYEQKIRHFIDSTGYLKGKLDFNLLERLYKEIGEIYTRRMYFNESFSGTDELSRRAFNIIRRAKKAGKKTKALAFEDNSKDWDEATDREMLAAMMQNMRSHIAANALPNFFQTIDEEFGGDCKRYVDALWQQSILMKDGTKIKFRKKAFDKDLGVRFGKSLTEYRESLSEALTPIYDSIAVQERYLCAAKLRMEQDMPLYSDANSTMRMSYGQVGEYLLAGKPSGYYTTAESLHDKMKKGEDIFDYKVEPIMKQLFCAGNYAPYADKETGKLQLCFLTNNDITGGNSGSPVFNGKGELLGLAFDGNWDSLASDIFFDSQLARCISVDVRYMLYMMDKWGHADRLLKELNVK